MESIGHVYQRFWLVSKSEDTHIFGCRQYGNAVRLEPPEFIDGALRIMVTLLALLAQSWLVGVRMLPAYPNQLANMFLDRSDAALIEMRLLQPGQRLVCERGRAEGPRTLLEGIPQFGLRKRRPGRRLRRAGNPSRNRVLPRR